MQAFRNAAKGYQESGQKVNGICLSTASVVNGVQDMLLLLLGGGSAFGGFDES